MGLFSKKPKPQQAQGGGVVANPAASQSQAGYYQAALQQGLSGQTTVVMSQLYGGNITTTNYPSWSSTAPFTYAESLSQDEIKWLKKLFSYEPLRRKLLLMSKDGVIPDDLQP